MSDPDKLKRFEKAASTMESINTVTMFVLPPATAIYGIWVGDWRPFGTAAVIGFAVLVLGLFVMAARDRARAA